MTIVAPSGVRTTVTHNRAVDLWRELGYPALELVARIDLRQNTLELRAPGRPTCRVTAHGQRARLTVAEVRAFLLDAARLDRRAPLTLSLVPRDVESADPVSVVMETETPYSVAAAASWLGWPDLRRFSGSWPATVEERLSCRSNDYWPLDLSAEALGLGRLPDSRMPIPDSVGHTGISVIIPCRGDQEVLTGLLETLVESAMRLPETVSWECLVIDDCSDPPLTLNNDMPAQVSIVRLARQHYSGGARNIGIRNAKYPIAMFCDADIRVPGNFLSEHVMRHVLAPNIIAVSMRERVPVGQPIPDRPPRSDTDTRHQARYGTGSVCFVDVDEPITVRPLQQSRYFRDFGYRTRVGPVDLPFMVKGVCFSMDAQLARSVEFPPDFVGWGPEDSCFAAKCISNGAFILPITCASVFHLDHEPRSGSKVRQEAELAANMKRYAKHLDSAADIPWPT